MRYLDGIKNEYFECECGDLGHVCKMSYFEDDTKDEASIYLDISLNPHYGFFRRLWNAVKYVLLIRNAFGQYEEILLDIEEGRHMKEFLEKWLDKYQ